MILETIEILDSNLTLTLEQLQATVTNGDYDDLLANYNLLIMISNGLVLINKNDKICKVIAPTDLNNYVKFDNYAAETKAGIIKTGGASYTGLTLDSSKYLKIVKASNAEIDKRTNTFYSIVPANLDYAVRSVRPITKTDLTETITINTIYNLGLQTNIDITLPSGQIGDFIQFDFISKETATTLSVTSTNGLIGYDLIPEVNKVYSLYFDWGIIDYTDDADNPINYGWRFNYSEYELNSI